MEPAKKEASEEVEVAAPGLADPIAAPAEAEGEEGADAEGEVAAQVRAGEEDQPPIPLPPPLVVTQEEEEVAPAAGSSSPPSSHPENEEPMFAKAEEQADITITDQDVLFGRGGLTNRHIGNLRYRDIISIHRQDYVSAQKTEKPNVARRIVKAIRTGKNPGRFLRKGPGGRWVEVSDKEAAWKASQALREKTRWSSMRQETKHPASPLAVDSPTVQKVEMTHATHAGSPSKATKRTAEAEEFAAVKRVKYEYPTEQLQAQPSAIQVGYAAASLPTEISQITVPAVSSVGDKKVGANYMLPAASLNTNSMDMFPKEEDVIFGRGGRTNHHPGNKRLREIVNKYRDVYNQARKIDKPKVSRLIVSALRNANPPSRFLRMNEETAMWEDVGEKRAAEKVSQTLREKDRDAKLDYLARRSLDQHKAMERAVMKLAFVQEAAQAANAAKAASAAATAEVATAADADIKAKTPEETNGDNATGDVKVEEAPASCLEEGPLLM